MDSPKESRLQRNKGSEMVVIKYGPAKVYLLFTALMVLRCWTYGSYNLLSFGSDIILFNLLSWPSLD